MSDEKKYSINDTIAMKVPNLLQEIQTLTEENQKLRRLMEERREKGFAKTVGNALDHLEDMKPETK